MWHARPRNGRVGRFGCFAAVSFPTLHEGLPMAFVAWVWEREGEPMPWRVDRYLPSASDFLSDGECCVTELISPQVPVATVMGEVVSWLKLTAMPPRIEFNAERCIVVVHTA